MGPDMVTHDNHVTLFGIHGIHDRIDHVSSAYQDIIGRDILLTQFFLGDPAKFIQCIFYCSAFPFLPIRICRASFS